MNRKIFEMKNTLLEIENNMQRSLDELKTRRIKLQEICNHQIVLKFDDKKPHKVGPIYTCVCPICDKVKKFYADKIEESEFKDSKVIDLTKLDFKESIKIYDKIVEYIMENYNDFYENSIDSNVLRDSIYKFILEKEYVYDVESASFYYDVNHKKSKINLYESYRKK